MMKVKSITYGRTFNNDNFEFSRIDLTVDIEEDDPIEVFEELQDMIIDFRRAENKRIRKEG